MNKTICPICKKPLGERDELYADWFEGCQWFVLYHKKDGKDWCGQANHPVVESATEAVRKLSRKAY